MTEDAITFAFWLCTPCFETYGTIANAYIEPDRVFWARMTEIQNTRAPSVPLTMDELARALDDRSSPMSKLVEDWRTGRLKAGA